MYDVCWRRLVKISWKERGRKNVRKLIGDETFAKGFTKPNYYKLYPGIEIIGSPVARG